RLDATIREALAHNRDLLASRATLAQLQALSAASEGAEYPRLDLDASAGRQKYGAAFLGPEKLPPFTFYSVGFGVSYLFDFAGGVRRTVEQQRALAVAQQHEVEAAELAVSGNVAHQALAAGSARAQIESVEALLADDESNLKLVQDAFEAGSANRVDVLNAQSQRANDQTLLPALRRELSTAEHALALLVGEAPAAWSAPDFKLEEFASPSSVPQTLPAELAHRRPDILAAEAQLHAATAAVGIAAANLYPQISLTATASMQSTVLHSLFDSNSSAAGLTGSLTQPLFDHGTLRARERAAREAMHASLANYEQVVLHSFGQVADALEALEHDRELLDSEQSAVAISGENLGLTRESYTAGNTGVLQVLEAQRQSQQARLGLVRAQAQHFEDSIDLQLALGGRMPAS
ncbi:MAG TPA: efflux transporter outer membrane subunit, partial [Steroidobacteraceae bacterium]|nr:efflux transporter outer membrane subunit [Steroidobacteraceae bacterium]